MIFQTHGKYPCGNVQYLIFSIDRCLIRSIYTVQSKTVSLMKYNNYNTKCFRFDIQDQCTQNLKIKICAPTLYDMIPALQF